MPIEVIEADLSRPEHQRHVLLLTDAYARDPMGGGQPLPPDVADRLVDGLRAVPNAVVLLAYVEGEPAGIATCFTAFSTFAAKPLINIHDLAVRPEYRGQGLSRALLAAVEAKARELGCCKVTLEVIDGNHRARGVYEAAGFVGDYPYSPDGAVYFLQKKL